MQMNSVPQHLHSEDRVEYERILDEALRSARIRSEIAAAGQRLNIEQLRTMALSATALIAEAAAAEYQHYVKVREELRNPVPPAPTARDTASAEAGGAGLVGTVGEVAETAGAGAGAVAAVLTPILAGTAAVIFLLVGYVLKMFDPEPEFARTILTAGWVFGALTAAGILIAAIGLLTTALRNRPAHTHDPYGELSEEVARAKEAWREALLERGLMPFLRKALADPGAAAEMRYSPPPAATSRIPHLGYDRPGFSSPYDGTASARPSFTSPDYTSPDFGGPEHQPE